MNKFNLSNFLVENKLTQDSRVKCLLESSQIPTTDRVVLDRFKSSKDTLKVMLRERGYEV